MRCLKSWDKDDELVPCFNLFMKGRIVSGITLASENNIDLFCITRNQRMIRDLVDLTISK